MHNKFAEAGFIMRYTCRAQYRQTDRRYSIYRQRYTLQKRFRTQWPNSDFLNAIAEQPKPAQNSTVRQMQIKQRLRANFILLFVTSDDRLNYPRYGQSQQRMSHTEIPRQKSRLTSTVRLIPTEDFAHRNTEAEKWILYENHCSFILYRQIFCTELQFYF